MLGLVYVIHWSFPTARLYSACSSVERTWSWSAVAVFNAEVPGAGAGLLFCRLVSVRSVVTYSSDRLIS